MKLAMLAAVAWISSGALIEIANAQQYTLSEQLLAGDNHFEKAEDYPDTLTLPEGWTTAFTKMSAVTSKTNREVMSCLLVYESEEGAKERDGYIYQFGDLMRKRATLPPDEVATQRAALRKRIDEVVISEWAVGTIQAGEEWTVNYDFKTADCGGSYLGPIHTHPIQSNAVHSDTDLFNAIADNHALDLTVHKDQVCAFIRDNSSPSAEKVMRWEVASNFLSSPAPSSIPIPMARVAAGIVGAHGGAYYCGMIGQPLKKIAPAVQQENNPRVILGAKALLVMTKNSDPARDFSLDFPFTPILDREFLATTAKVVGEPLSTVKAWSGKKVFERLSAVLTKNADFAFSNGVILPDTRFIVNEAPQRLFSCRLQKSVNCEVDRITSGEFGVQEASYFQSESFYRIAELQSGDSGRYLLTEVDGGTGISLRGQGKLTGNELKMSGPAYLKGDGYEIKGSFDDWKPVGDVQFRRGGEKAWRPGRFENGHLTQTGEAK